MKFSLASSRRPSWIPAPEEMENEDQVKLKVENKYCDDLASALKFWDNQCIVDAYFNQTTSQTEDERKLKDRLRKKKFQQRMNSVNEIDKRMLDIATIHQDPLRESRRSMSEQRDNAFEHYQNKEKLQLLSTSQVKAINALPAGKKGTYKIKQQANEEI